MENEKQTKNQAAVSDVSIVQKEGRENTVNKQHAWIFHSTSLYA